MYVEIKDEKSLMELKMVLHYADTATGRKHTQTIAKVLESVDTELYALYKKQLTEYL